MSFDPSAVIKAFLERLSVSIVLAASVTSGSILFIPQLYVLIDGTFVIFVWIVFIFCSVWLAWEAIGWTRGIAKMGQEEARRKRSKLYLDIFQMQKEFGGLSGMLANRSNHPEAASEIADKYARLRELGISTPKIDVTAGAWDFEEHNAFLTALMPLLSNSPMRDLKSHARSLLGK